MQSQKVWYFAVLCCTDTDIHHIGLPLDNGSEKDVIIQISLYNSKDLRYLHFSAFITVLKNDPDLSAISQTLIPQVIQTLFVATGCDYVSFFSGIGKASFMRYFYQYAEFISSGTDATPGTLADTGLEHNKGFLAFLRLVGTAYFKKHALAFSMPSPVILFNKYNNPTTTALEQHCLWLEDIRQNIWDRIQFEDETIPSVDSLYCHVLAIQYSHEIPGSSPLLTLVSTEDRVMGLTCCTKFFNFFLTISFAGGKGTGMMP